MRCLRDVAARGARSSSKRSLACPPDRRRETMHHIRWRVRRRAAQRSRPAALTRPLGLLSSTPVLARAAVQLGPRAGLTG
jgi:hypothetical protein